jgi:hypothetical protein
MFLTLKAPNAMGKKKSASASSMTKVSRDWGASTITNRKVSKLRSFGFISSSDDDIRLPGPSSRPKIFKGLYRHARRFSDNHQRKRDPKKRKKRK